MLFRFLLETVETIANVSAGKNEKREEAEIGKHGSSRSWLDARESAALVAGQPRSRSRAARSAGSTARLGDRGHYNWVHPQVIEIDRGSTSDGLFSAESKRNVATKGVLFGIF